MVKCSWLLTVLAVTALGCAEERARDKAKGEKMAEGRDEQAAPAEGLVAYYPLDGSGEDRTEGKRHGKLVGPVPAADRHGDEKGALHFDGVDDMIIIDPPPPLNKTGATISVWALFMVAGAFGPWRCCTCGTKYSRKRRG